MAHRYPKRSQYKYTKKPYRLRNWQAYEAALRKRGELTLWFSEEGIGAWHAAANSSPGGQRIYSDLAIETALTVRSVYRCGLRQTEGFFKSVCALMKLDIPIPDHSTLSRRSKQLERITDCVAPAAGPVHILIDSTGLKIHSGNASSEQTSSRRAWRKLHLAVDAVSGKILSSEITTHQTGDASRVPGLLDQIDGEIASVTADGAYDCGPVYAAVEKHSPDHRIKVVIPPRRNARSRRKNSPLMSQRDKVIETISEIGRRRWHKESGYNWRSLVETAVYRYKTIIGRCLRSRTIHNQRTESKIACAIINIMTGLGMPDSYCAA